jgi:hypothetical protein
MPVALMVAPDRRPRESRACIADDVSPSSARSRPTFGVRVDGGIPVTSLPAVGSRSLPGRTSSPTARSASVWAAYVRRDAGTSTHPCRRATSREPCCDGRRSRSPAPAMPCSRASNSRKPDLVVSLDYLLFSLSWLTQHVPRTDPRATARTFCHPGRKNRQGYAGSG